MSLPFAVSMPVTSEVDFSVLCMYIEISAEPVGRRDRVADVEQAADGRGLDAGVDVLLQGRRRVAAVRVARVRPFAMCACCRVQRLP